MLLGVSGFLYLSYELLDIGLNKEYGIKTGFYNFGWHLSQALFPLFCLLFSISGANFIRNRQWAFKAIKALSILALAYFSAFILMGAHNKIAFIVGLSFFMFFLLSFVIAKLEAKNV